MKQVVQNMKSGEIRVESIPAPAMRSGGILVKNHYSLISAGTEKSSVDLGKMNLVQKAKSRPDDVRKVLKEIKQNGFFPTYRKVMSKLDSLKTLGYSSAGVVLAVAEDSSRFKPGDRVACAGAGYATHSDIVFVPDNLAVRVPDGVELSDAAYTTVGAIALQGVRQAAPTIGENVVVIGLGLVGLIAVQVLKANGCRVLGVDTDPESVALAMRLGADKACLRTDDVDSITASFTDGYGADAVVIAAATRSSDPVQLAGEIARDRSRIVMIGATGMNMPRGPYYMKELEFRLSRSYGPGRYDRSYEEKGNDYPIGFVRWTENRNMKEFVHLLEEKRMDVKSLTTHRFHLAEATQAYKLISGRKTERYVGILLEYDKETNEVSPQIQTGKASEVFSPSTDSFRKTPLTIGFIGAGSFAQANLLPALRNSQGVVFDTVCTATGVSAKTAQGQFGFARTTTDSNAVMADQRIGTVFVATRHNLHASLALEALKAGKNVFVEKPLALKEEELVALAQFYRGNDEHELPVLMVGYNRRFAPLSRQLKSFFRDSGEPLVVNYRINAGYIPKSHWTQDPVEGGGRILGEVCHFVDFIAYLTDSRIEKVYAESISAGNSAVVNNDNLNITLKLTNGSLGIITYIANGDSALPKERIEVTSAKRAGIIDNFQLAYFYKNGKGTKAGTGKVDKGIKDEIAAFMRAVNVEHRPLIPFDDLVNTSLATLKVITSLSVGESVAV